MPLEIIRTVREALESGEPLRPGDVAALCATTEQLWHQIATASHLAFRTSDHRREYMRHYMRRYRAAKREEAALAASTSGSEEIH